MSCQSIARRGRFGAFAAFGATALSTLAVAASAQAPSVPVAASTATVAIAASAGAVPRAAASVAGARLAERAGDGSGSGDRGAPFATRYAQFEPVAFGRIPGWTRDDLRASIEVFRISCRAIARRPAWADTCAALAQTSIADASDARNFFEAHFHAYQVIDPGRGADGLITGYYEPQLRGSRSRSPRYRYPVYATPRDLYLLDARSLSGAATQWLRVDGGWLRAAAPGSADAREYHLALGGERPDVADKRYRVRIDGDRLVPYWSRQDIERQGVDAQVLAWVDNAWALYSMQIQGSGRITLDDGNDLRLAYAEQNGQPFMPHVSGSDQALVASAITTRGLEVAGAAAAPASRDSVADLIAQLKGGAAAATPAGAAAPTTTLRASTPAAPAPNDPAVQSMIAALLGNAADPRSAARPVPMPRPAAETRRARDPQVQDMISALLGQGPAAGRASAAAPVAGGAGPRAVAPAAASVAPGGNTGINDPSFVFFRTIPATSSGPPGALGVPLTAGRSLAVDPRTTPLGAPVFIETAAPLGGGSLQRLMLAQDTGGAIRGSVRGDFFWGHGREAGTLASATNAEGHMWLLLPRTLALGALAPSMRTRSLAGRAPDCVIPDDDSCVE